MISWMDTRLWLSMATLFRMENRLAQKDSYPLLGCPDLVTKTLKIHRSVISTKKRIFFLGYLFFFWLCTLAEAGGNAHTVFWLEPRSNTIIDRQVAHEIGSRASMIVLRAARDSENAAYSFPAVVGRLKGYAPRSPVLSYAWANRKTEKGRIEANLLKGMAIGNALAEVDRDGNKKVTFLDVTDPIMRRNVVQRLTAERPNLGVDGFAIDLSMRTPSVRPKPLANICRKKREYCASYATGMDALFASLRNALGVDGYLVYNGLWNFAPGMLEDQVKLLEQANAAAIEYFGMDPNTARHNFSSDILPYLNIMQRLPKNKYVLVFARGPWNYTDYVADYLWQRYLYASYLLAKREGDLFKYHASFQIPAHKGRAGGLDVYADWDNNLGNPLGPYSVESGLYTREFSGGFVAVAPVDGVGGKIKLTGTRYTLEGEPLSGEIRLSPGESLIALNKLDLDHTRPVIDVRGARHMASWAWSKAELQKTPTGEYLRLAPLPTNLTGEHDMLLDYERSLTPFQKLEIHAKLLNPASEILAVAEVDDPAGKNSWAVLKIGMNRNIPDKPQTHEAVDFRVPSTKRKHEMWPMIHTQYEPSDKEIFILDGSKAFIGAGYHFRRWSHVRFVGPLDVFSVTLSHPVQIR